MIDSNLNHKPLKIYQMETNLKNLPGITDILLSVHELKRNQNETNESVNRAVEVIKRSNLSLDDKANAVKLLYCVNELNELSHKYWDELEGLEPFFYKDVILDEEEA